MPRLTNRNPSYRKHGSGQAVVTLNGRDCYLGPHGTEASRREYDRLIAEWHANGRRPPVENGAAITIAELANAFRKHAATYYVKNGRPTQEQNTIKAAMRPLLRLYADTLARDFGPLALKAVRQVMIDTGWARTHINQQVSRIKLMVKWAVENEMIPPSVHHGVSAVSGLRKGRSGVRESDPVRPVANSYVDAIKPFVSDQVWAMVDLQRLTGMRPGEAVAMRGMDIDTSGKCWIYRPGEHKTEHHGRTREIYIGPRGQRTIREFLKADLQAYIFSPIDAEADRRAEQRTNRKTRVQPSQVKRAERSRKRARLRERAPQDRYTVDSYRRAIARGCEQAFPVPADLDEAGRDAWRREHSWFPHRLRHSAATRVRKEYGLEAARVVLGHSSPQITEVYAEIDGAKAADVMLKIG